MAKNKTFYLDNDVIDYLSNIKNASHYVNELIKQDMNKEERIEDKIERIIMKVVAEKGVSIPKENKRGRKKASALLEGTENI